MKAENLCRLLGHSLGEAVCSLGLPHPISEAGYFSVENSKWHMRERRKRGSPHRGASVALPNAPAPPRSALTAARPYQPSTCRIERGGPCSILSSPCQQLGDTFA